MNADDRVQLEGVWAEVRAVSAKVDILLERDRVDRMQIEDHEERMRSVERWKLSIPASILLALAGLLGVLVKGG